MTAREEEVGALFVEASETIESIVARRVRAPRATIEDACAFAWARLVARPDVVDGPRERAIGPSRARRTASAGAAARRSSPPMTAGFTTERR